MEKAYMIMDIPVSVYAEYKLEERGKYLIKVNRYFASSKICSVCGKKNPNCLYLKEFITVNVETEWIVM